ncbi:dTDP-4-dehydrorhamnose reductase family protein [Conyzicola nivalis]|nr:SDR family oxidoreductase [Conyzicola nivalis]
MTNVLILGGAGMLGSALVDRLAGRPEFSTTVTARRLPEKPTPGVRFVTFAVGDPNLADVLSGFGEGDYVINCIGLIKHRMDDANPADRREAIRVNSAFPYELAELAESQGFRVIQIATDCVYAGTTGRYTEDSPHDPLDVYGKTKSLGEVPHPLFLNVRCSIIGREVSGATSLVEWLLSQPANGEIRGFLDHEWNGVTTETFADLAIGLVATKSELSGTHHFVPSSSMNKSDLSSLILSTFGRDDVTVVPTVTGRPVDRSLATTDQALNESLWRAAGFATAPTVEDLVRRMAP